VDDIWKTFEETLRKTSMLDRTWREMVKRIAVWKLALGIFSMRVHHNLTSSHPLRCPPPFDGALVTFDGALYAAETWVGVLRLLVGADQTVSVNMSPLSDHGKP